MVGADRAENDDYEVVADCGLRLEDVKGDGSTTRRHLSSQNREAQRCSISPLLQHPPRKKK